MSKSKHRDDPFALIPEQVLRSEACKTLNHASFKVLVIMACQYRGPSRRYAGNNGALALTEFYAKQFGLNGRDTLYRALAELRACGIIVRTRRGIRSRRLFSLYALAWAPVVSVNGETLAQPKAPTDVLDEHGDRPPDWRKWTRPTIGNGRNNFLTDHREHTLPKVGNDPAVSRPITSTERPSDVPTIGNTSRISDRLPRRALREKITRLLLELPHLPDGDIARMLTTDSMQVAAVRQSLNQSRPRSLGTRSS